MNLERYERGIKDEFRNRTVPFRVVLVMQGGGALGAYHGGVYQALHEGGLEPDWIIGTSIRAINGAIIAGNRIEERGERLRAFWKKLEAAGPWDFLPPFLGRNMATACIYKFGLPGFFIPNPLASMNWLLPVGVEHAALYSTEPLRKTLADHIDFTEINSGAPRFSFGLVHVETGKLRYFDNRTDEMGLQHVLASGALPPSFPAVRIDGEPYSDAGFVNNTPLEIVFDEKPGCDLIIFAPNLWIRGGGEPKSLADALNREKSIGFSSRSDQQIAHHVQLHRRGHVIHELIDALPEDKKDILQRRHIAGYDRESFMHLIQLDARGLESEGLYRDIDFTAWAIAERWEAGYADTCRMLEKKPWEKPVALINGVAVHNS